MSDCRGEAAFGRGPLSPAVGSSRLDLATKLDRGDRSLWVLHLYREAAEAGGSWVWVGRRTAPKDRVVPDPERARSEADRRARGKLRRYVAPNRLNRLVSLTYSGDGLHDPRILRQDVAQFVRRLRRDTGGEALPYAWVPEWHKSGHGLHIHMAHGAYVPKPLIAEAWGHEFVDMRLLRGRRPDQRATLAKSRAAGGYLAKVRAAGCYKRRIPESRDRDYRLPREGHSVREEPCP